MNRIKQLRMERGWTQEELGEKLNVKRAAVSKYESGNVPLTDDTIKKLVRIFDSSADYILGLNDNVGESSKEKKLISDLCFFIKDDNTYVDSYLPFKLSFLREKKGITKEFLVEYFQYWGENVTENDIEEFETGSKVPSNYMLKKLSKLFEVPFYFILGTDIDKQITELITFIEDKNNNIKVADTELDDEDREYIKLSLEKSLKDISFYIKHKYTFKKYFNYVRECSDFIENEQDDLEYYISNLAEDAKTSLILKIKEDLKKND